MIFKPTTIQEAVALRAANPDTSVYLAGGTDDLRLGSNAEGKALIDINGLCSDSIEEKDGKLYIGALCTLQTLKECEKVPAFLREAAGFCSSFIKRNSATVGGNLALRRSDSYLAAALVAANAVVLATSTDGDVEAPVSKYLSCEKACLIRAIVIEKDLTGWVKRFGKTSSSHATLIAAVSGNTYALSVSGSSLACGDTPDLAAGMTFCDDITGSADYKKYLAETVFTLRR